MRKQANTFGEKVKLARKEKGLSTRRLAELCCISHTEISNIEKGDRSKPAILTLKAFEKYLDIPFEESAKAFGYSDESINYTEKNIIVSYEKYDKLVQDSKNEKKFLEFTIEQHRHLAMDSLEELEKVYKYLEKKDNIDEKMLIKLQNVQRWIKMIEKKKKYDNDIRYL